MADIVRVTRTLEYVGPRDWVADTIARSAVKGHYRVASGKYVAETLVTDPVPVTEEEAADAPRS